MQHSCIFIFLHEQFKFITHMHIGKYEIAVIGGSHAGLAAAHTLGRSKRRTIVFDTCRPRNLVSASSHNLSGNDGVSPAHLRDVALRDLHLFDHVTIVHKGIVNAAPSKSGYELITADNEVLTVRKIILATGVTDHLPAVNGMAALWGRKIFHCTYCHGWEARDQPALVLVNGAIAWDVAMSISQWNKQLTFLLNGSIIADATKKEHLLQQGWSIVDTPVTSVSEVEGEVAIWLSDGRRISAPVVYTKPLKVRFNNELASLLGCQLSQSGSVLTDTSMQTSVPGVFAAGDLSHPGYHQVSEAISTGHKAAAFCNNQLCKEEFMASMVT
jgi:thioredoxin reductase